MKPTRISGNLRKADIGTTALPRMAIYAGCSMLTVLFWAYKCGSQLTEMGIVPNQKLPITNTIACKGPTEFAVISLNKKGQFAFSMLEVSPKVKAAAIQAVAYQHGICSDAEQLTELESLPFLAIDINELPRLLSLPYNRRNQLVEFAKFKPVSEDQLIACAVATRQFNRELFKRPITISLRIDTEVKSGKVLQLIDKLQLQGFKQISYQNQIF